MAERGVGGRWVNGGRIFFILGYRRRGGGGRQRERVWRRRRGRRLGEAGIRGGHVDRGAESGGVDKGIEKNKGKMGGGPSEFGELDRSEGEFGPKQMGWTRGVNLQELGTVRHHGRGRSRRRRPGGEAVSGSGGTSIVAERVEVGSIIARQRGKLSACNCSPPFASTDSGLEKLAGSGVELHLIQCTEGMRGGGVEVSVVDDGRREELVTVPVFFMAERGRSGGGGRVKEVGGMAEGGRIGGLVDGKRKRGELVGERPLKRALIEEDICILPASKAVTQPRSYQ
ncbi:hypothetical protein Salat_2095400 [Sesamum alatum]|uniref:Uncharacterized protein n=1 Tax=Sesamum alatum TaxID=300844 RepID=A0AAE1Y0H3_9LAMI|nr:hypothetical protein Salat_2095400 [Sesamum alatum]